MFGAHAASGEIDIGEGVEFGYYDLNIIGADAMRYRHDRLALIRASDGMKLARTNFKIDRIEHRSDEIYATGIADEDDIIAKLVGAHMDMKSRAVIIDDEFGCRYNSIFHR